MVHNIDIATFAIGVEQRVGTWVDGKPIYRYITTGTVPAYNSASTFGGVTIVTLPFRADTVVSLNGRVSSKSVAGGSGQYTHNSYSLPAMNNKAVAVAVDTIENDTVATTKTQVGIFNFDSTNDFQGQPATIIIEYTKNA